MALPWAQIIKGGTQAVDGQSGGSGGKSEGIFGKIGARSNMPKEAIMGLGSGLIQSIQAAKLKNKAESAMPSMIDARQASFLAELNQKRKSIDTGADFAAGMQAADTTNAGTNNAIVQATGGDTGGAIQALLQSERGTNDAKNNILAQGQQQQMGYTSMYNDLNNKIAARQMQLQMYRSQQARAEWAQKQQSANKNLMAGVAGLMEQKQQYGKPVTENPSASPTNNATSDLSSVNDPNSGFNTGWSFKGKQDTTPAAPAVNNIEMKGQTDVAAPVTSANNMLGGGAGALLSLKK